MLQADQIARQEERLSGRAACPQAKVPSYQDLLDAALDDTFPASDPLAIGAATQVYEPRTTPRDCVDWTLKPGACKPVGQAGEAGDAASLPQGERSARCDARLLRTQLIASRRVPAGPCWIEQTTEAATLSWLDGGGAVQQLELALEELRCLLAQEVLERPEPA
ncbi:MAG: hypothetical protein EOP35_21055 [Rubrivivax sp.]|nr:MAG: hypothetical protein EOP35_21055 [Rubrivivax sp.]